jgi:hypothetical protein
MIYAGEMRSDGMTYLLSFIKIGSRIQKFLGGGDTQSVTQT